MGTQKNIERKTSKTDAKGKLSLLAKAKNALMSSMSSAKGGKAKGKAPSASGHAETHGSASMKKAHAPATGKKAAPAPAKAEAHGKKAAAPASTQAAKPSAKTTAPKASSAKASANQRRAEAALAKAQTQHDDSVCREVACEGLSTTAGYCRMHYIKNWKKIKRKELILKEGKLNQYIEELVAKYPDKYIEAIRQDLASDKDFAQVIYDLDLDESIDDFDVEGEGVEGIIDSIKRDFDDEGETF